MRNFIEKHIGGTLLSCRLDCAIKMELRVVAIKVSRCQHGKRRKVLGCIVLKYFKAYRQGFFLPCHSRRKFLAVSYFYISRSLQDTPLLKFSLDGLEITLEDHIVHDPAIEEALRYNP